MSTLVFFGIINIRIEGRGKVKQKGQALVEFILIIPVLLLIIMGMVDFGNVIYQKYKLENNLDDIVSYYRKNQNETIRKYTEENNIIMSTQTNQNELTIQLQKQVPVNTPILNRILGNPHQIETERTIINE